MRTLFYDNRYLLGLTAVIVLVAGISALINLPRLEDPRITHRFPIVVTALPGASAERVEALINEPIEDSLQEIPEIAHVDSQARAGVSVIQIELAAQVTSATNKEVFGEIRDKLVEASREFPPEASAPFFDDKRGAAAYTLIWALTWQADAPTSLNVLTRLAEELGDRIRNLPGTELVRLFGAPQEEITVTLPPGEDVALGMDAGQIARLIAAADSKAPAGRLFAEDRELSIEVEGELGSLERIARIPLMQSTSGEVTLLGDVASIARGIQLPTEQQAFVGSERAIFVAARMEDSLRVDRWTERALDAAQQFQDTLDDRIGLSVVFEQSRYTEQRLGALSSQLLAGVGVVMLVVLLFMGWRAALIVGLSLPLSMAFATFSLTFFGEEIHQMSIFGMIIGIGLLIDNAIVMTDEVRRNRMVRGMAARDAVGEAVRHLMVPLLASTLTTILGFMPIFLLPGNIGDFVGPIAISVVMALIGSFVLSLTVIASLAAIFLRSAAAPGATSAPPEAKHSIWRSGIELPAFSAFAREALIFAVRHPRPAVALAVVLPISGFVLAGTLGNVFFPSADRDHFEIKMWLPSDRGINETVRATQAMTQHILGAEGVERLTWLAGGSTPSVYYNQIMNRDNTPYYAQAIVHANSVGRAKALVSELQAGLTRAFPAAQVVVKPFGQGPPVEAPVTFRLLGPSLDQLRLYGEEVRVALASQPEVVHSRASLRSGDAKLWLIADEDAARLAGLSLGEIAAQFQGRLSGATSGATILEGVESVPVRVRASEAERGSLERVGALNLNTAHGWLPAAALGELELRPEFASIARRDGQRVNSVLGYLTPDARAIDVTQAVLDRLDEQGFSMAPGYRLEVAGDADEQGEAIGLLLTNLPVLVVLMVATLVLAFKSLVIAAMIGMVAFLSVGLGMFSLWLSGFPIGFNPIIGSAGLIGVAINGSIVVLAAIRANPKARAGDAEAIADETLGCGRHLLSTTLTTVGGFMPLLLSGGTFWPPLATVIAGGVGLSIILSVVFTPALYAWLFAGRRQAPVPVQASTSESGTQAGTAPLQGGLA